MDRVRKDAIQNFEASSIHRKINVQFALVVLTMAAACVAMINTLPTSYLNNLVPLTITIGLSILFYLAIKYQRTVSRLIGDTGLLCDNCGQSTIARPDHIRCQSVSDANVATCVNCGQTLTLTVNEAT